MNNLLSEFKLKNMKLKNRIVMSPMCTGMADESGKINDWHIDHYVTRAMGGVALIIVEATAVEFEGRYIKTDLGLWSNEQGQELKKLVEKVHEYDTKIGIQLSHSGRKSKIDRNKVYSVTDEPFNEYYYEPKKMSDEDIYNMINSFKLSAKRASDAGFDLLEIHAAHGNLINVFLSPLTNKRNDKWGGSIEKRCLFLELLLKSVREVWDGKKPLAVRISAREYVEGGSTEDDIDYIINMCKENGVDIIDVSAGGVVFTGMKDYHRNQIELAININKRNNVPVMAGGWIKEVKQADDIIKNGNVDLIYLGRELFRNPYWPLLAYRDNSEFNKIPKAYRNSFNEKIYE